MHYNTKRRLFKHSMRVILFFMGIIQYVEDDTVTARLNTLAQLNHCTVQKRLHTTANGVSKIQWRIQREFSPHNYYQLYVERLNKPNFKGFLLRFPFRPAHDHANLDDVVADLQEYFLQRHQGTPVQGAGDWDPAAGPAAGGPRARGLRQPFISSAADIICSLHSRVTRLQNQYYNTI